MVVAHPGIEAMLRSSCPVRRATRCGVKRSIMSSRAYGFATSKTLKSG